jgi:hypothetical protein
LRALARGTPGRFAWILRAACRACAASAWFSSATTPRQAAGALLCSKCVAGPVVTSSRACRQDSGTTRDMFSHRHLTYRAGSGADGPSLLTSMPRGQCCRADLSVGSWAFGPLTFYRVHRTRRQLPAKSEPYLASRV